ncbi:uncharacterized protein KD926_006193 [Aspergillus affinis]|uniref:uncharacterized protein n=1 Tax=Aspergillus affinis TaxID=1070780 RepID=UPI0022FE1EA7|nr:uncharacterized protein KD926_006193 [Aspergillus affinis]KAI9042069.1 hypothetical protein KD926_006193 [Aspergillus affinis]
MESTVVNASLRSRRTPRLSPHFQDRSLAAATKYFRLANVPDEIIPSESDLKEKSRQQIAIPPAFASLRKQAADFEVEQFYARVKTKLGEQNVKIVDEDLARCPDAPLAERLART